MTEWKTLRACPIISEITLNYHLTLSHLNIISCTFKLEVVITKDKATIILSVLEQWPLVKRRRRKPRQIKVTRAGHSTHPLGLWSNAAEQVLQ